MVECHFSEAQCGKHAIALEGIACSKPLLPRVTFPNRSIFFSLD